MQNPVIRYFGFTVKLDKHGNWVARHNRKIVIKDTDWVSFYQSMKNHPEAVA